MDEYIDTEKKMLNGRGGGDKERKKGGKSILYYK